MKPWIKADEVRRRVPAGRDLPQRFDDFIRAEPPFRVEWNDLDAYSLKPSATKEAVPFLRLPDGGLVALWYVEPSPAVVHIGGHGELAVIARSFDDFLKVAASRRSGLWDLDNPPSPFVVSGVEGEPDTAGLAELQERFERWFQEHTSLLPPLRTPEAEGLRQRVHGIAVAMIRDGLSKVFTPASPWWSMSFRIERGGTEPSITYLDYGAWHPVPERFGLADEIAALLGLVRDKTRVCYELSVGCTGIVSVDRDRELLLVPPGPTTKTEP